MTLAELIARYRTDANDKVLPYFVSDDEVTAWLNDAVAEAAIRGRLIHESDNAALCKIAVKAGKSVYPLHPSMYELSYVAHRVPGQAQRCPVLLVSTEWLDSGVPGWRDREALPTFAVQTDKSLRLVPRPVVDGELLLEGYRLPLALLEDKEDEPELNAAHHRHLVHWALHRGFSIPDTEFFDPERAARSEAAFTQYFGLRPDSDLRRETREDVPQHVVAFWP